MIVKDGTFTDTFSISYLAPAMSKINKEFLLEAINSIQTGSKEKQRFVKRFMYEAQVKNRLFYRVISCFVPCLRDSEMLRVWFTFIGSYSSQFILRYLSCRKFLETVELQIALKNYDPARDKRFTGTVKLRHVPKVV